MTRARGAALAVALATLLAAPGHAATAGATGKPCAGGTELARSDTARVYRLRGAVYGCRFAAGRAHRLAGLAGAAPAARLAGDAVALVWSRTVRTFDLRTGRRMYGARFDAPIERLALVAYGPFAVETAGRIVTVDGEGRLVADPGPGVVPGSLRPRSGWFEWRNDSAAGAPVRTRNAYSRPSRSCRDGARKLVLAESEEVRVVSYGGGLVIACRRGDLSHGLRLADNRQGENEKGGDFSETIVNGRFVALSGTFQDPGGSIVDCWIDEWDIGSGVRTLYRLYPGEPVTGGPFDGCRDVEVVMAPDGRLAWQVRGRRLGRASRTWSPAGTTVLDAGPGVEPGSLAIDGHTARWTRAGEPQAADLSALP